MIRVATRGTHGKADGRRHLARPRLRKKHKIEMNLEGERA